MSHDDAKIKHSKRLHDDETHIKKQVKIAKAHGIPVTEPHRLAKHHVMDCGNPKCIMCGNPRKVFGEKTIQEKKFDEIKYD
jgi:hypothetical protein